MAEKSKGRAKRLRFIWPPQKRSRGLPTNNWDQHHKLIRNPGTQGVIAKSRIIKISIKEIEKHIRMPEKSLDITTPSVNHLNFASVTQYGNDILLVTAAEIPDLEPYTKNLNKLDTMNSSLPDQIQPTPLEEYIKKVRRLRE